MKSRNFAKRQCKLQWLTPPIFGAATVKAIGGTLAKGQSH